MTSLCRTLVRDYLDSSPCQGFDQRPLLPYMNGLKQERLQVICGWHTMLGARRAALASLARLARQARTFSAVTRAVSLQQETPAVCAAKQADWLVCRSFAAAAEPAPAPAAASNGYVKTVRV